MRTWPCLFDRGDCQSFSVVFHPLTVQGVALSVVLLLLCLLNTAELARYLLPFAYAATGQKLAWRV